MAVYYFAYGINMDRDHVAEICTGALPISSAVLEDHSFVINEPGWASVTPATGSRVHGVLWRVGTDCLVKLDAFEGVEEGLYERTNMRVRTLAGETSAEIYVATNRREGAPQTDYIDRIARAARRAGAPHEYLLELDQWREKALRAGLE